MRMLPILLITLSVCSACRRTPPPAPPQPALSQNQGPAIQGRLLERIDVPNYSYLRLQSAQGEIWAAVPTAKVEKGADLTIANAMPMQNFESTTLKRTFKTIYFGTLGQAQGHPVLASAALVAGESIAKASTKDARSIAELYAQKDTLKNTSVTLRGKVVKYNTGILGRTWIHLQDGTGSPASRTHDITVTTQDTTALGQVIQVQGTVHLDQDFGSGYSYPVIVENAKIVK